MIINSSVTDQFRIEFFKGMLKKESKMHPDVAYLLYEKINDSEKITTERLSNIIIQACALYHDIYTIDRIAMCTPIFREMPYHAALSLVNSLPVLETLLTRGYNLATDDRLFHDFFRTCDIDIIKFFVKNNKKSTTDSALSFKIANTSVSRNSAKILQFLASQGIPYHLTKLSCVELSASKDIMDNVVFLMGVGVDFTSIKNKALRYAIEIGHKEAISKLLAIKADFSKTPDEVLIFRFGKPEKAVKSLESKTDLHLSYALVHWHMKNSKLPALTLINNAPDFLKPYYLTIMANKL